MPACVYVLSGCSRTWVSMLEACLHVLPTSSCWSHSLLRFPAVSVYDLCLLFWLLKSFVKTLVSKNIIVLLFYLNVNCMHVSVFRVFLGVSCLRLSAHSISVLSFGVFGENSLVENWLVCEISNDNNSFPLTGFQQFYSFCLAFTNGRSFSPSFFIYSVQVTLPIFFLFHCLVAYLFRTVRGSNCFELNAARSEVGCFCFCFWLFCFCL